MDLPPDPRLKVPSQYSREETIAAVKDYYQFLTKMPFLEPRDILDPPPEGWAAGCQAEIPKRNDEVFELLRSCHTSILNAKTGLLCLIRDLRLFQQGR